MRHHIAAALTALMVFSLAAPAAADDTYLLRYDEARGSATLTGSMFLYRTGGAVATYGVVGVENRFDGGSVRVRANFAFGGFAPLSGNGSVSLSAASLVGCVRVAGVGEKCTEAFGSSPGSNRFAELGPFSTTGNRMIEAELRLVSGDSTAMVLGQVTSITVTDV